MKRKSKLIAGADLFVTAFAIATARFLLIGPWCIVAIAVLAIRALVGSARSSSAEYCRSIAIGGVLTYIFRSVATIDVLSSRQWLGGWVFVLLVVVESLRLSKAVGLGGLTVGVASLLIFPPSDTLTIDYRIGVWNVEFLFVLFGYLATWGCSVLLARWRALSLDYVLAPVVVFVPIVVALPFILSAREEATAFGLFWLWAFIVPGVASGIVSSLRAVLAVRLDSLTKTKRP